MTEQIPVQPNRKTWFLRLTIAAGLAVVAALAPFVGLTPLGLLLVYGLLWLILHLCRPTRKVSAIALVACGLCLLDLAWIGVSDPSELGRRSQCHSNLKRIALAIHCYHERHGTFPPAYIADSQGKPIHSWRVLLLPYLDQSDLYNRYSFDEPWDGPNNRKLHDRIASAYTCPSDDGPRANCTATNYVLVTGPSTLFPGPRSVDLGEIHKHIGKPLKDVILVVEVASSGIHWMEPRDLPLSEMDFKVNGQRAKSISSRHEGSWNYGYGPTVYAAYADGSVNELPLTLAPEAVKDLLTIDPGTGEAIGSH